MKLRRRHVFIYVILISVVCLFVVFLSFDKYARNSSINQKNKYIIEANLSEADKKKLIDENIQVDMFLPYIKEEGFSLKNYEYYNLLARYNRTLSKADIVNKGNILVAEDFTLKSLKEILSNKVYSLDQLIILASTESPIYPESNAEFYPNYPFGLSNTDYYITDYKPNNLKPINKAYTYNGDKLLLKDEANKQLNLMCDSLTLVTNKSCGGLKIRYGYLSYEYTEKNGKTLPKFIKPGHNDFQLGNTISFEKSETFNENDLYLWLLDNAHKYGFVQRYPYDKVNVTKISEEYGVFRYVGIKNAKSVFENNSSIEERHTKE